MAPPASSDEPARHKKAKKHKSDKEEKKRHKKKSQERPATDDAPPSGAAERKKRKHEEGREEKRDGKKKSKKEVKAAEAEAVEGRDAKMKRAMEDERFAAARTDPRFRPMRKKEAKVELDSRFSSMMTDPRFASSEAPVDKRGRRRKKAARDNPMLHYYLNQEEEEEDGKEKEKEEKEKVVEDEEEEEVEDDDEQEEEESSSSDDDEEDEYVDDDADSIGSDIAHYLMARHDDTPMIDKETNRLAVVNMDWDHIKAVDLYMVMTSCLPNGGRVLSVSVYPSEFGLKCMEIESTQGPAALVDANADDNDDRDDIHDHDDNNDDDDDEDISDEGISDDDDDEQEIDSDKENNKLRAYELNRLRYYYAVVVCDSSATANHLYVTLDGTEFLKTANVFDLQFIPDSMEFKHPARDVATEAPPNYKEPDFETRALQHSRVKLSWDDDEPERKKVLRRKFTDDQLDELDMYLASDDSASDDDDMGNSGDESLPNGASKRKLTKEERLAILLQGDKSDEEQSDDQDMEITFNTELEDLSKRILERKNDEEKTVWEKHQEKMKEKRKARKRGLKESNDYSSEDEQDDDDDFFAEELSDEETKPSKHKKQKLKTKDKAKRKEKSTEEHLEQEATKEELELLVAADQDTTNGAKGYNLKRKKGKKGKKGKEESVEDKLPDIDLSKDERFSEMFTSNLFAVDPTDPQYKRSAVFMRKQAGKEGARAGKADLEPPMERSDLGGTLPPDDAVTKHDDQKPDGASTEKLQILSAVKSLKRNLSSFKQASKGSR